MFLKCSTEEGWRRSRGPIVWEMNYFILVMSGGKCIKKSVLLYKILMFFSMCFISYEPEDELV